MKKITILFGFWSLLFGICTAQTQFQIAIGGTGNAKSIIQTADGGYAVAGYGSDMCIVKLDANGTMQWSKTVGGTSDEIAYSIIQTTDGGYIVRGVTFSLGAGSQDIYFVNLDGSGTLQCVKTIGRT